MRLKPICETYMTALLSDTYLTIAGESQGTYREKGSKFLAFGLPDFQPPGI